MRVISEKVGITTLLFIQLRLLPSEQIQDLLLAAGDCSQSLHDGASCLSGCLSGRCEKDLRQTHLDCHSPYLKTLMRKWMNGKWRPDQACNKWSQLCTCRNQLLWLNLSRRGKRPSPFLDLMNCFHFHTYFSKRYCRRSSAFPWGFDTTSWPAVVKITRIMNGWERFFNIWTCIKAVRLQDLPLAGRHFFQASYEALGSFFSHSCAWACISLL